MKKSPKQLELKLFSGWGGKRKDAGRKNKSGQPAHVKREKVDFKKPLHVTLRLREGYPSLRRPVVLKLLQQCCAKAKAYDFHVIHFSILSNHIHFIAEAKNNEALARGMQSLASRFAKAFKKMMVRFKDFKKAIKGALFAARYHLKTIRNPTQMKNTLNYVLLNFAKHGKMIEHIDDYSSARVFARWKNLLGKNYDLIIAWEARAKPHDPHKYGLSEPRSWLAREGWMRAG